MTGEADRSRLHAELEYFNSIPWCSELLQSTPNIVIGLGHGSRSASDGEPSPFFSQTIDTPSTIPAFIHFHSWPPPSASGSSSSSAADGPLPIREVKAPLSLGSGVDGHGGVCHAGVVCAILDEVIGLLAFVNKAAGTLAELPLVTGRLDVRFRRPVRTGGGAAILVTARVVEETGGGAAGGRSPAVAAEFLCEGTVQDEHGRVLATGEALFVQLRRMRL